MFDSAKLDNILEKKEFNKIEPRLRDELLNAQFDLIEQKKHSVLVLIQGADGVGKGRVANMLYSWLDARHVHTLAYDEDLNNDFRRPLIWKYWRDLPAYGEIGIVLGTWYHDALSAFTREKTDEAGFTRYMEHINRFEAMLAAENVSVLKIWLHMDANEAHKRQKEARDGERLRYPSVLEWRELDSKKERNKLIECANTMARLTSTGYAPWHVVSATDFPYCIVSVGELLRDLLIKKTQPGESAEETDKKEAAKNQSFLSRNNILNALNLSKTIEKKNYNDELEKQQQRISLLTSDRKFSRLGMVCAFEGNDAAGKGGAIRRLRDALDIRKFEVVPTSAPDENEKAHPYLWRFWRKIPARGRITIFDRTWYGRVLVERIEGFCTESDWMRAYDEINDFEEELSESDYIIIKFWLAISPEEQLKRFKAREDIPYKRFKITDEDWRNREKLPLYTDAVNDMVDRTNTSFAPWILVEAEDKRYARVKILKSIADKIEEAFERK